MGVLPPFIPVAVKVTLAPAQMVVDVAAIVMLVGNGPGTTFTIIGVEVAVVGLEQPGVAVTMQVIVPPVPVIEYVELLVPTGVPVLYH